MKLLYGWFRKRTRCHKSSVCSNWLQSKRVFPLRKNSLKSPKFSQIAEAQAYKWRLWPRSFLRFSIGLDFHLDYMIEAIINYTWLDKLLQEDVLGFLSNCKQPKHNALLHPIWLVRLGHYTQNPIERRGVVYTLRARHNCWLHTRA